MSASVKPIDGPAAHTTAMTAAVVSSPWICCHLLLFSVLPVALWRCRYATRQHMAATEHPWGWLVRTFLINYPLNTFFWVVNRRLTKLAYASTALDAVTAL